ncbi:MAG: NADPH-dependent 7-cyano-7-deazaguanine reductase QueF [Methylomonas sp.]|nr:NADPH-dependent 7-cyano-7-deazaguanine reductase QueF [Methylomonas sp.]PPD21854.1 MAG: NADPH-dependent 7-cyano-7-deazaguanine reductase QueF [Methylomonas sp.]PPD27135.1 MAG: NADPH-dependent 7-cyano-7-deazaguanine reductase QueF [Methylomonas sp.]PPD39090.1 MAG: NADPH-dependent 7-cyano-7-deazaguanine reductase QueF [Methylomonas sp.]PPD42317.1 MAG: NADPH-dependent 7-cyano-7-deazaguanine reductase QueF [Methylomonas sp.]
MTTQPSSNLATFDNPRPARDFTVRIDIPEFTCLCPLTGQPDFAKLIIEYVPDQLCVELKSLKLYMWTFRERGAFHEAVTHEILDHIVAAIAPNFMRLRAEFNVRGGIYTTVIAEHRKPDWQAPELVNLP